MCRLLYARANTSFNPSQHLEQFAALCKNSKEYQGHGWGCSVLINDAWQHYHCIKPIWEDSIPELGAVDVIIAHARSAFKDEGIVVENNMPFANGEYVFAFNGELRGVRLKQAGRIGAEKIFNTILECNQTGDILSALASATRVIRSRTRYIRAMNIIIAQRHKAYLYSQFAEDPEYFKMHTARGKQLVICSERFQDSTFLSEGEQVLTWEPIQTEKVEVF